MSHTYTEDTLVQQTTAEYRMNFQRKIMLFFIIPFFLDLHPPEG